MSSSSSPTPSSSTTTTSPESSTGGTSSSDITSANYFFGFVITFIALLLVFIGCGVGSWRRFRIIGTAWDVRLQGMDEGPFRGRKRCRRKLVRPVFWETWTYPKLPTTAPSEGNNWGGVQPISAAFLWSRSRFVSSQRNKPESSSSSPMRSSRRNSPSPGLCTRLISFVNSRRRPRSNYPPKPPPPVERPPPDAVQVAVMISMPSPSSSTNGQATLPSNDAGQSSAVGEYQIGIMQLPWPRNDAS